MAFRRSTDDSVASPRWLAANRSALAEAGMPTTILDDIRSWNYTLLHGDDEFGSGWSVEWLSAEQCSKLLDVVSAGLKSDAGLNLVYQLRRIVGDADIG